MGASGLIPYAGRVSTGLRLFVRARISEGIDREVFVVLRDLLAGVDEVKR
jgi:hypothetical protein